MTFRYNAARALMMGMKPGMAVQPLWMQRLKSTEMLSSLINEPGHPDPGDKRECLEDQWDIDGVIKIQGDIGLGLVQYGEVCVDVPSPMSLPFQWQAEAADV